MRFARIGPAGHERGAVVDDDGAARLLPRDWGDIDEGFWTGVRHADAAQRWADGVLTDVASASQRVGSPIARPGKIVCVGLNYRDHAAETGAPIPHEPILFMKAPSCVVAPSTTSWSRAGRPRPIGKSSSAWSSGRRPGTWTRRPMRPA